MEKLLQINTEKREYLPHFIRIRFQGYFCKSDIAIFAEGHLKLRLQAL